MKECLNYFSKKNKAIYHYCLSAFFCFFLFSANINANSVNDSIALKKLDSLYKKHRGKYDTISYKNFHLILKQSKKIEAAILEMESYKALAWYHGNTPNNKRRLDSTVYYFNRFESRLGILDSLKNANTIFGHYLNKGNILANRFGLTDLGLKAYHKAYNYMDSLSLNYKTIYKIYVSQVYNDKRKIDKALEILNTAMKDTASLGLPFKMLLMQNLAKNYRQNNEIKKSYSTNKSLLRLAEQNENEYYIWWTKNEMSYDYYLLGKIKRGIDSALVVRKYYKKNLNQDALFNNSLYLGRCYKDQGDSNLAIKYLEEALENKNSTNLKPEVYGLLASTHIERREYEKADYYYQKKEEVLDSIWSREQTLLTSYANVNQKLFDEKRKNKISEINNRLLEQENKRQQLLISMLTAVFFSVLLLLLIIYLIRKNREGEKEVQTLKANEKKLLEEQISMKDNELEATANFLSKKVKILNVIKEQLDDKSYTHDEKIKNTSKAITALINNAADISVLTDKISSRYSMLTLALKEKHPDLSSRELDYCLLTKLNLSLKETAAILNVSSGTVKVTRSRLKTKMNIPAEKTLKEYLEAIVA